MHEAIFSDSGFGGGLSTIDLAKALIDEGFHPMTMYFPLVVHGAMLIEPTETESKASLDQFIVAMRSIAERAKAGRPEPQGGAGPCPAAAARRDAGGAQAGAGLQNAGARRRRCVRGRGGNGRWRIRPLLRRRRPPARDARRRPRCAIASRSPRCWPNGCRSAGWCWRSPAAPASMPSISPSASRSLEWQPSDAERRCAWRRSRRGGPRRACRTSCAPVAIDVVEPDLADRPGRRGAQHQHGRTSARGRRRSACSTGPRGCCRPAAPLILYGPWLQRCDRDRAEQPGVRCRAQERRSGLGPAPGRGFRRRGRRPAACAWPKRADAGQQPDAALRRRRIKPKFYQPALDSRAWTRASNTQNRRSRRSNVLLTATIEIEGEHLPVKLRNLSAEGALVEADLLPAAGSKIMFHRKDLSVRGAGRLGRRPSRLASPSTASSIPTRCCAMSRRRDPSKQLNYRRPGFSVRELSPEQRKLFERWMWSPGPAKPGE